MPGDPFYLTTAIHYPNGRPHIGHAYEMIAGDVIARVAREQGHDVRFQTGTDEHGLKMVQAARAADVPIAEFAERMSSDFKAMADALNISYDRFIRTVEPAHHTASQALWRAMEAAGDLYLARYEGWYSVRDEAYYEDKELTDGEGGERLSPQGTPVSWTSEETWFFRLSRYQDALLELYRARPDFIQPESRRNEVMRFVEGGLVDLSVSRTSFDWGVPVPDSPGHVMYVWVDALTNYLTGAGYPERLDRYWPAALHLIGKDIVRFHAVYWPAFLMSARLPLPQKVYGHGFLLQRGEKMSKSSGNVVDPGDLATRFGVDTLRYFLLRDVVFGQDGSWSEAAIVTRCNAELANSFGNLAQRVLSFAAKHCPDGLPWSAEHSPDDQALIESVRQACSVDLPARFEAYEFSVGLDAWLHAVFACNAYVDAQAPWALRKSDPRRMGEVLAVLVDCIRMLAIAVRPVVPASADAILDQVGVAPAKRGWRHLDDSDWHHALTPAPATPVFRRLELA